MSIRRNPLKHSAGFFVSLGLAMGFVPLQAQAQNSPEIDADHRILVADCNVAGGQVAELCARDDVESVWRRDVFMETLGRLVSDSNGAVGTLVLYGHVAQVDGAAFVLTDGTDPDDPVSLYLNAIDLEVVRQAGVDDLHLVALNADDGMALSAVEDVAADEAETVETVDSVEIAEGDEIPDAREPIEPLEAVDANNADEANDTDGEGEAPNAMATRVSTTQAQPSLVAEPTSRLTPRTIDQLAICRALASRSLDDGVELADMQAPKALAACEEAARVLVKEPEVQYLHARALDASGLGGAAIDVYLAASKLGSGKADASLGRAYMASDLDARRALAQGALELGAERGDAVAAFRLYQLLDGQNLQTRLALLAQSTQGGYPPAILETARRVVEEPGSVDLDADQVEELLSDAASRGDVVSKSYLGRRWVVNGDDAQREQAVDFLRDAAGKRDKAASSTLALLILSGDVAAQDGDDPRAMLEMAVNEGNATVKSALAALILTQDGAKADAARIVELLSSAAAGGDAGSATNLGTLYRTGLLVDQDMGLASRWFLIGLALGSEEFSEQIFGYKAWDSRGRDGLILAMKSYLAESGHLAGEINNNADSALARGVTEFLTSADPLAEAALLVTPK